MKHTVKFSLLPTSNPEVADGPRCVINAPNETERDLLLQVIEKRLPVAKGSGYASTEKSIIRTSRYECPCCYNVLTALVEVSCISTDPKEDAQASGLYRIVIGPDAAGSGPTKISVVKLVVTEVPVYNEVMPSHPFRFLLKKFSPSRS